MNQEPEGNLSDEESRGQISDLWDMARSALTQEKPDWGAADYHMRDSIRLAREFGDQADLAKCHFHYAELLQQQGYPDHARQQLEKAGAIFRDEGLDSWIQQAEALAAKLG